MTVCKELNGVNNKFYDNNLFLSYYTKHVCDFFLSDISDVSCPPGYELGRYSCFKAFDHQISWGEADAYCRYSENGHLAEPRNRDDNDLVYR